MNEWDPELTFAGRKLSIDMDSRENPDKLSLGVVACRLKQEEERAHALWYGTDPCEVMILPYELLWKVSSGTDRFSGINK